MIELDRLHALDITPPAVAEHPVGVPRAWLAQARAGVLHPCPQDWPKRLAKESWIPVDEAENLFAHLGIWPYADLMFLLTGAVPECVILCQDRGRDRRLAVTKAFPASMVALAVLVLRRLGVPAPASDLLTPLKRRLKRQRAWAIDELYLNNWTGEREKRVTVFAWPSDQETNDIPAAGRWKCQRLHDGRLAFAFRSRAGVPCEVISRPDVIRDRDLVLALAGAPKGLMQAGGLREAIKAASPAQVSRDGAGATMAELHRMVAEVQRNPDQS